MESINAKYRAYTQILREELVPAAGCTEPIALAFAAARARDVLGCLPDRVEAYVSGNIIKNVKSVVVPNTGGLKGIPAALAAGLVAGDAARVLEVLEGVSEADAPRIAAYLEACPIRVQPAESGRVFDIDLFLYHGEDSVHLRILDYHTNIVLIEHNGRRIHEAPQLALSPDGLTPRDVLCVRDIIDYADAVDLAEVADVLEKQIACNMAIAEEGLRHEYGACIGQVLLSTCGSDVMTRARAKAAAGSDARMSGCDLPVIIVSGSGNQGLTCSVPVIEYARELGAPHTTLLRALIVSNLVTIHQKTGIGRLSAFCGAINAGCGAGAGIAYLYGGGYDAVAHTLVNALAIVSGIICDGAKPSCAAKIASAVDAGLLGFHMYQQGKQFCGGDGIVKKGVENTLKNIGRLGREGMRETDREIIKMMCE